MTQDIDVDRGGKEEAPAERRILLGDGLLSQGVILEEYLHPLGYEIDRCWELDRLQERLATGSHVLAILDESLFADGSVKPGALLEEVARRMSVILLVSRPGEGVIPMPAGAGRVVILVKPVSRENLKAQIRLLTGEA